MAISCVGWVTNHFVSTRFPGQSDVTAAVGCVLRTLSICVVNDLNHFSAFAVGIVANIYGRLFNGNAFVVMVTCLSVISWSVHLCANLCSHCE